MEFDVKRVYTTVNADELKIGSKVIVADNLSDLKRYVEREENYCTLTSICNEEYTCRFELSSGSRYSLAYLVEEKKLKWSDLKIGDIVRSKNGQYIRMVTGFDSGYEGVEVGLSWISQSELEEDWEKVENEND
jgi:hypothetical protein